MADRITEVPSLESPFGFDELSAAIRLELRVVVERLVREELVAALGAEPYERTAARQGYQHTARPRRIATASGRMDLSVPRGRLFEEGGGMREWQSVLLPRYARRTREVDAALVGLYLAGTNTRRMKRALGVLWKDTPLSKSTVSRLLVVLREQFEGWRTRDLSAERFAILYLDAAYLAVRLAQRVERLPVAVAVGVREDGQKVLVGLWLYASEGRAAWGAVLEDLAARGMAAPALAVIDGSKGLRAALAERWKAEQMMAPMQHEMSDVRESKEALRQDYRERLMAKDDSDGDHLVPQTDRGHDIVVRKCAMNREDPESSATEYLYVLNIDGTGLQPSGLLATQFSSRMRT